MGITKRVALANGYIGIMREMTQAQAKAIYLARYWGPAHIDSLPEELGFHVFDAAVTTLDCIRSRLVENRAGTKDPTAK